MSTRRKPTRDKSNPAPRSQASILSIAFAIAMAFFLVIGMVAVALPQFIGGGSDTDAPQPEEPPSIQEQGEGEEQRLRDRIEEDPDDLSAKSQLAVLLSNSGRLDEAIPYYEEVLDARPEDTDLRLSFARALDRQGYQLDAEIQLERVLEEDSENVEAMFLLAEVKSDDPEVPEEESTELYERVVEIAPDSYHAEMARERLGQSDDEAPAEAGDGDEDATSEDQD